MKSDNTEDTEGSPIHEFMSPETAKGVIIRDVTIAVLFFAAIGIIAFSLSGMWPPIVNVVSGSMEPNVDKGDMLFVVNPEKLDTDGDGAPEIRTYREAKQRNQKSLGSYGQVIIYQSTGTDQPYPILHRARFHVEHGENWYSKANKSLIEADDCTELKNCPAPRTGYITKGDNNPSYDQVIGISEPVPHEAIFAVAKYKIPDIGWIRLAVQEPSTPSDANPPSKETPTP